MVMFTFEVLNYHDFLNEIFFISFFLNLSQKIQLKQKVADAFLERFQLKPNEVEALKGSRNEPVTEVKCTVDIDVMLLELCVESYPWRKGHSALSLTRITNFQRRSKEL